MHLFVDGYILVFLLPANLVIDIEVVIYWSKSGKSIHQSRTTNLWVQYRRCRNYSNDFSVVHLLLFTSHVLILYSAYSILFSFIILKDQPIGSSCKHMQHRQMDQTKNCFYKGLHQGRTHTLNCHLQTMCPYFQSLHLNIYMFFLIFEEKCYNFVPPSPFLLFFI